MLRNKRGGGKACQGHCSVRGREKKPELPLSLCTCSNTLLTSVSSGIWNSRLRIHFYNIGFDSWAIQREWQLYWISVNSTQLKWISIFSCDHFERKENLKQGETWKGRKLLAYLPWFHQILEWNNKDIVHVYSTVLGIHGDIRSCLMISHIWDSWMEN